MELDELKNIWNTNKATFNNKGEGELALMLKGTSQSIVTKLKRSVWFELIFTVAVGVGLLIYALTLPSGALKWTSVALLVMLVGYIFYYIKKIMLLNHFDSSADTIRLNLERLVNSLTSYLRFYKRSYTILYPVYFFLGLLFGGLKRGTDEFLHVLLLPRSIAIIVTFGILFFYCSTWLTNWYLKKLYGNHLDKLKAMLRDIQTEQV